MTVMGRSATVADRPQAADGQWQFSGRLTAHANAVTAMQAQLRTQIAMTPQQKKRLSYAKDRRNTYGENNKSSRKNIPLSKALDIRSERRAQDSALAKAVAATNVHQLDAVENSVRSTKPRQWRKWPDKPLGEVLIRKNQISTKNDV